MFTKGQWVTHILVGHPMRVQRNPNKEDIDQGLVWCEWINRGYHLAAMGQSELTPLPPGQWPAWPDGGEKPPL